MTSDEEVLGKLEACILNHCPRILAKIGNGSTGKTGHLLLIAQNSELAARSSSDVARLAKIEKNLRDALAALEKLSGATIRELNYSLPEVALEAYKGPTYAGMGAPSRTRDNAAFSHRLEALTSLLEGTHELRQKPAFQMQSSSRRNYRATAVAAGCLKVWREEISPEEP
ncbi:MAG: hypothetical protein VXY45_05280, partial [Pseudomonadota bacterium]|nr:hypothetical protein [Pseudomonadota bacterium]